MPAPTVVILAAGEGTRMRSDLPKVLHPLCGLPLVLWPVRAAQAAGAGRVVVVDGPNERLRDVLPEGVERVVQAEARGTGDAVRAAAGLVDPDAPVLVLAGDVPLITPEALRELAEAHAASDAAATIATMVLADPSGYGRVVRDPGGRVLRVVETKVAGDATARELAIDEVNTGIFAFDGAALLAALEEIGADNAQGEYYLPDTLPAIGARGLAVGAHPVDDPVLALGVNDRVDLAEVRRLAQARIHAAHARAGATIVDPASTQIDVDVRLGRDALVEPGTCLRGRTAVGAGATVGPQTTAIDAEIGAGASVVHSYLVGAEVGEGASVGPFAYLRPGARLASGAKAGTFVEIKNSTVGEGAKVPHLAYVGDADVGPGANLGAGTITANYDGRAKHRTRIGAGARTGVDTMLVAPVSVGDGAYTGAGSTITEDVPPGALGIARARQANVEGYAERVAAGARAAAPGEPPHGADRR